jgi:hypothetical protein
MKNMFTSFLSAFRLPSLKRVTRAGPAEPLAKPGQTHLAQINGGTSGRPSPRQMLLPDADLTKSVPRHERYGVSALR